MVKIEVNNKVFYLLLTILIIIIIGLTVLAVAPSNGHAFDQLDLGLLTINSDSIGIGMVTPAQSVNIRGSILLDSSILPNQFVRIRSHGSIAGQGALRFDQASNHFFTMWTTETGTLGKLHTGYDGTALSNAQITLRGDGNVGIGNSNPQSKLDVSGNVKADNVGPSAFVREQVNAVHGVKYVSSSSQVTRVTKNCPAGTTLINWGVDGHNAYTGTKYSYCNCDKKENGVTASLLNDFNPNNNFQCACFLLCYKN